MTTSHCLAIAIAPHQSGRVVMASAAPQSTLHRGFTLIEVLVVMSLLSLIMVAMGSSLRTMVQTETRVDERLQRIDEMRVVNNFLRQILGRIDLIKINNSSAAMGPTIQFAASASSISWVGIMPARHGAGGRYFFRLSSEETLAGKALVLRYIPWSMQTDFPEWAQGERRILVRGSTDFKVEAEGLPIDIQATPADWPRAWQLGWSVKDAIPQRLRLTWADQKGTWPPLVVGLIPTFQSQSSVGGFVTGGSVR